MKRFILIATIMFLAFCSSCATMTSEHSRTESSEMVESCAPPNQELLFLVTNENFAETPYFTKAILITADGRVLDASDAIYDNRNEKYTDWESRLIQLSQSKDVAQTVLQTDLYQMYRYFEHADKAINTKMIDYAPPANDAGIRYLYLLQKTRDGAYRQQLLCKTGESNQYRNDQTTIQFCEWMKEQHYFAKEIQQQQQQHRQ
jgi:hypothetical protein